MRITMVVLLTVLAWSACVSAAATEEEEVAEQPRVTLNYIYVSCNDLSAMREFYVGLLGLEEQSYSDEGQMRWLVCRCGGLELMFFPAAAPMPIIKGWAVQPGWEGGTVECVSWSIQVPEAQYGAMVARLQDHGVSVFFDKPRWFQDSYWGFPVKDPMGNTVEVFCLPRERPRSTTWPEAT